MMEKSMFGSSIKTYPSKGNRYSSYRPSCQVFKDDHDERFDQLIKAEENKKLVTSKKSVVERGAFRSTKSYFHSTRKLTILNNIQNYSCTNGKSSLLPHSKKKKVRTKISKRNKENTLKGCSRLYHSQSDSDKELSALALSAYKLDPNLNPLAEYKRRRAECLKLKPKSPSPPIIKNILANSCVSNNESTHPKLPNILLDRSNSSIDSLHPTPAAPIGTVFKKPTGFLEGSSKLFYDNLHNRNRGPTKIRKKLYENFSLDNGSDADDSCEYAKKSFSRSSGIRRSILRGRTSQRIVDELFNSDNENENEYRCSEDFNPGLASTPNFARKKSSLDQSCEVNTPNFTRKKSPDQSCEVNNAKDDNCENQLDNTPNYFPLLCINLTKNSISSKSLKSSPINQSEVSSQNIRLTINDSPDISKNDENENCAQPLDSSTDSYAGSSSNESNSSSSALSSDSEQERTNCDADKSMADSSENDSLRRLVKRSTPPSVVSPFTPYSNKSYKRISSKLVDESVEFRNNLSNLTNQLHSCSIEDEHYTENVEELTNSVSDLVNLLDLFSLPSNRNHSKNDESANSKPDLMSQSYSSCHENEEDQFESEPVSFINNTSTSPQVTETTRNSPFVEVTVESEMKEPSLPNEITACETKDITNASSLDVTVESKMKEPSLSELIVCISPIHASEESTSKNVEFAGWSEDEYQLAVERRDEFETAFKKPEPEFVQPEDVIPPHLRLITNRRKRIKVMPTLNEENSNSDNEINFSTNTRNNPMPSQTLQMCSQNQTYLHASRFLERSSMCNSIILAAGKKWRRSFITLKNIREYGVEMQTEHENLKGRSWRKNFENLISSQKDENLELREIGECSTLRTGSNETFLNSNFTCLDSSRWPSKARFSLCVNQKSPPQQNQTDESRVLSSSDTSKLFDDKSYISFVGSQQNSRIENNYDLEAGDYSRSYKVSLECYDIRDHFSAKERVLRYCKQTEPLPFEKCFDNRLLQNCKKIGEGVYGEVFMLKRNRAHCSVLKIIPIEGDKLINDEKQKKFDEIVSELVISIELSELRNRKDYYTDNFAELQNCFCVYGKYPKRLLDLWDDYNDSKGSDNDSPKVFDDSQLYIILELSHGGEDVESFIFNNAQQALSVFVQVAYALAVAEQAFGFEHRDLHWGNILVSKTKDDRTRYTIGESESIVKLRGVKVTIIDYTLSRISVNNCVVFNDIGQDPDLFTAQGDFQFEIYRLMRDEVNNIWDQFMPKTNVFWLCYLLDKMIKEVRYRRTETQIHKTNFIRLQGFHELILGFASCHELIDHSYFTRTVSATR